MACGERCKRGNKRLAERTKLATEVREFAEVFE